MSIDDLVERETREYRKDVWLQSRAMHRRVSRNIHEMELPRSSSS